MTEFTDRVYKYDRPIPYWSDRDEWEQGFYQTGAIGTFWGIVFVTRWEHGVWLGFNWKGKEHRRTFDTCYSTRYCVTLAERFATNVVLSR